MMARRFWRRLRGLGTFWFGRTWAKKSRRGWPSQRDNAGSSHRKTTDREEPHTSVSEEEPAGPMEEVVPTTAEVAPATEGVVPTTREEPRTSVSHLFKIF